MKFDFRVYSRLAKSVCVIPFYAQTPCLLAMDDFYPDHKKKNSEVHFTTISNQFGSKSIANV